MTDAEIEGKARAIYESHSQAWTGNVWDWSRAAHEVKEIYRGHARRGTAPRPPDPDIVDAMQRLKERGFS